MFKPASDESKKEAQLFNRYQDPTGEFTNRDLQFSEWYIRHQVWLKHVVMGFLIASIVVFGGYGLYGIFEYALYGYHHDELTRAGLTRNAVSVQAIQKNVAATPLTFDSVSYFSSAENTADFLAFASNPNERWVAEVMYVFSNGNEETATSSTWIWPKQTTALTAFAAPGVIGTDQARLVIKKINWRRMDNRIYPNPSQFLTDRLHWEITDFVFTPASTVQGAAFSQVRFKLHNRSVFGYWQGSFVAVLKKGDIVVAIRPFVLDSWLAGEGRLVELIVRDENVDIDTIEVFANLNLFDTDNYQLTE